MSDVLLSESVSESGKCAKYSSTSPSPEVEGSGTNAGRKLVRKAQTKIIWLVSLAIEIGIVPWRM